MSTEPSAAAPRSYALRVLGCKVAQADAQAFARTLEAAGAVREEAARAELVVVSACTVTARADRDALRLIRRLRRESPGARLVIRGCLARRAAEALAALPEVDAVEDTGAFQTPLRLEPGSVAGTLGTLGTLDPAAAFPGGRTRLFLKVQDGCNRRCAYCVVPFLRGPERSAALEEVAAAVRAAGDAGVPEVVLTGVHLSSYGRDQGASLLSLLARLERDPPACRVRLSSLEPMDAGGEVVDLVAGSHVVVPHLHLPLQSGSAAVLGRMRRGPSPAGFAELVARAARLRPGIHVGTDVLAGFPGETDGEAEETEKLLLSLPLASLHVFTFSPRPGTEAARLEATAKVPAAVAALRAARLREIGAAKARSFRAAASGSTEEVVVLSGGRGLTGNYLRVSLEGYAPARPSRGERIRATLSWDSERDILAAAPGGPPAC